MAEPSGTSQFKVLYYFRGTWQITSRILGRAQLKSLKAALPGLKAVGVSDVAAITAEPGGAQAIKDRLAKYGVVDLGFEVRSDPEHLEVIKEVSDIYIFKKKEGDDTFEDYMMYQPALVVLDDNGVVKEPTWSWKTMGYENGEEVTKVPLKSFFPPYSIILVQVRPVLSDLANAIKEKRPVELAAANVAFPYSLFFTFANLLMS